MSRRTTGPFREGDSVQLTDPKGRLHTVVLAAGQGVPHPPRARCAHDDLIGEPEGIVVKAQPSGTQYLALRPLLADFVLSMPRGAAVVYPKDAAQIVAMGDVFPGARVVEAGAGSGALTCSLLRAVGDGGRVVSYERRAEFAEVARRNVRAVLRRPAPGLGAARRRRRRRTRRTSRPTGSCWTCSRPGRCCGAVGRGAGARRRAGRVRGHRRRSCPGWWRRCGSTAASPSRRPGRRWSGPGTSVGLAVRPEHRMVGHTAFLVSARRLAPGVTAAARQRRPAKRGGEADGASRPAPVNNFHDRHTRAARSRGSGRPATARPGRAGPAGPPAGPRDPPYPL